MSGQIANYLNAFAPSPRPHEWVMRFDIPQALRSALLSKGVDGEVIDNIDLLAESHRLPGCSVEPIPLWYKGSPYSYPSRSNRSGDLAIPFKEIIDKNFKYGVWKFFTEWVNLSDSAENGVGLPLNSIKADMLVDFYPYLNNELNANPTKLFTIRYRYVYPMSVSDFAELGQESTAIIIPSIVLAYNLWKYDV